ncbi:hypothetical protein [Shinella sp.]|uniref:hypothetical protein n=1 Tax=Shinella sp. TaxID=1870904 RepID=UPI0029A50418|nr:hypothetical protein [Shinella sp.]MDX3976571.1 hypothetical protein [Shinella sp.]
MEFRKHWDRWAWTLPATIIIIGFLRVLFGRSPFCSSTTEHCFREWVSALGGWAAVAAAVPTIYYLAKQVRSAIDHQRVNFALQIQSNMNLAAAAKQTSIEVRSQIDLVQRTLRSFSLPRVNQIHHIQVVCELAHDWFSRPVFSEFEARIGAQQNISVASMCIYLNGQIQGMNAATEEMLAAQSPHTFEMMVRGLNDVLDKADRYASSVCDKADQYVADMKRLNDSNSTQ